MYESLKSGLEVSIENHRNIVESPAGYSEEQRERSREEIRVCQERLRELS